MYVYFKKIKPKNQKKRKKIQIQKDKNRELYVINLFKEDIRYENLKKNERKYR